MLRGIDSGLPLLKGGWGAALFTEMPQHIVPQLKTTQGCPWGPAE